MHTTYYYLDKKTNIFFCSLLKVRKQNIKIYKSEKLDAPEGGGQLRVAVNQTWGIDHSLALQFLHVIQVLIRLHMDAQVAFGGGTVLADVAPAVIDLLIRFID